MSEKKTLAQLFAEGETLATAWNDAMSNNKFDVVAKKDAELAELEKDYLAQSQNECFSQCKEFENPFLAAIGTHTFEIMRHKDVNVEGSSVKKREIIKVPRIIDLERFESFAGKDCGYADINWKYSVQALNCLLTIRVAKQLGITDPEKIADSFYMKDAARQIKLGKVPDSNTEILKMLQKVIDQMMYQENPETGKNMYKASSHDVAYLLFCYSKKSKKELTVTTANNNTLRNLITDICYKVLWDKGYGVDFKVDKDKVTASATETEADAPKSEKQTAKTEADTPKDDKTTDGKPMAEPATAPTPRKRRQRKAA